MSDGDNFNQRVIEEFRENGGKVGGMFEGSPMILLTTSGARSGLPRVAPLVYTTEGDEIVIIASKGGAPTNPDWFRNLVANSEVTVEIGTDRFPATARVTEGEERQRLFDQQAALMPGFADYQRNTTREIPVVVLSRLS
jgi:deazaflavin-dependent oxidoreductase (nitroreductase family)